MRAPLPATRWRATAISSGLAPVCTVRGRASSALTLACTAWTPACPPEHWLVPPRWLAVPRSFVARRSGIVSGLIVIGSGDEIAVEEGGRALKLCFRQIQFGLQLV